MIEFSEPHLSNEGPHQLVVSEGYPFDAKGEKIINQTDVEGIADFIDNGLFPCAKDLVDFFYSHTGINRGSIVHYYVLTPEGTDQFIEAIEQHEFKFTEAKVISDLISHLDKYNNNRGDTNGLAGLFISVEF